MSGFHESLDAALGRAEVEALAKTLHKSVCGTEWDEWNQPCSWAGESWDVEENGPATCAYVGTTGLELPILASDWLAQRIEQAKAEALREAADALEGGLGVFGIPQTLYDTRIWLRRRADEIGGAS